MAKKRKNDKFTLVVFLAEREGFEPSNGVKPLHAFQACAFDQLSHLSIYMSLTQATINILTDIRQKSTFFSIFFVRD